MVRRLLLVERYKDEKEKSRCCGCVFVLGDVRSSASARAVALVHVMSEWWCGWRTDELKSKISKK
jgi:hypothetical protein